MIVARDHRLVADRLSLLDWKRRVFSLYAEVRTEPDPAAAWQTWREVRDELFGGHPQSPLSESTRGEFGGLDYFEYESSLRVLARVEDVAPEPLAIRASGGETIRFTRFARAHFSLRGTVHALGLYWLEAYGGGVFLPFADATSGRTTYGAGRYLLDTVKGADLGVDGEQLVLDFNFAYNPSCSYDARWVCPLAPPENRLPVSVDAGEQLHR